MIFKNKLDRLSLILTPLIIVALAALAVFMYFTESTQYFLLLVLFFTLTHFLTWAFHPRHYEVNDEDIRVVRFFKSRLFPFSGITEVSALPREAIKGSMRIFGSGGMFGYFGRFRNKTLGTYIMHVTDRDKLVLLRSEGKTILVSPDDRDGFLAACRSRIPAKG